MRVSHPGKGKARRTDVPFHGLEVPKDFDIHKLDPKGRETFTADVG